MSPLSGCFLPIFSKSLKERNLGVRIFSLSAIRNIPLKKKSNFPQCSQIEHFKNYVFDHQDPEDDDEEDDTTEPVQDLTEAVNSQPRQNGGPGNPAKSMLKHSDSSFGLHSPDSFNDDVQVY